MSDQSATQEQSENTAACTLSEPGEQTRIEWAREHIVPHFREGRLTADGFHATFDANDESLESLARFVGKESACCSSFTFELTYEPPYDEVELAITGPDGTRDLIERGFVEQFDRIDATTERTAPAESGE